MTCQIGVVVFLTAVLAWALWRERKDSLEKLAHKRYPMLRFRGPVTVFIRGNK